MVEEHNDQGDWHLHKGDVDDTLRNDDRNALLRSHSVIHGVQFSNTVCTIARDGKDVGVLNGHQVARCAERGFLRHVLGSAVLKERQHLLVARVSEY